MPRIIAWLLLALATLQVARAEQAAPAQDPAAPWQQTILVLMQRTPEHFRADSAYSGTYGAGIARTARRRAATQLAKDYGLALADDWPMQSLGLDCFVMSVPPGHSPESAAQALSADQRVEWAQPVQHYQGQGRSLYATQPAAQAWQLNDLHGQATGHNVRVAIIDSGVADKHPDLRGQVSASANFIDAASTPPETHGTAVAGIIAARSDTAQGIVGVAPQARLLAIRACAQGEDGRTACNTLSLAKALDYAIRENADIINLSLSGPRDRLLDKLLSAALARSIDVVAAVDKAEADGGFPASKAGVFAVADEATESIPSRAFRAPGRDIPTTGPQGNWIFVSGSSYAAAHVSGLLALIRQLQPKPPSNPLASLVRGPSGRIDACASLNQIAQARHSICNSSWAGKGG